MSMLSRPYVPVAMVMLACAIGCSNPDAIVGSGAASTIVVTVQTTGVQADSDGYQLARHSGGTWQDMGVHLFPNDTLILASMVVDTLGLVGVAVTCRVAAPHPRGIVVPPGTTTRLHFVVQCAKSGAARITATFDGFNENPFAFTISVEGTPIGVLRAGHSVLASDLFPGTNRILLTHQAGFCDLADPALHQAQVASDDTVALNIHVRCPVQPDTTDTFLIEQREYGGGTITSRYEILTERGSRSRTLTPPGGVDYGAAWSPDGTRIALFSNRSGSDELIVMRSDGAQVVRLADAAPSVDRLSLAWSPDGRMLAVTGQGDGRIRLIQADGSGERSIALGWNPYSFSWSPDARRFVTARDGDIVIVDVETGAVQPITTDGADPIDGDPTWSPRGDHIAWFSSRGVAACSRCLLNWRLWISDGEGRSPHATSAFGVGMVWSPRGSLLATLSGSHLAGVYDPTAGTITPAFPASPLAPAWAGNPWAPDERHVVYLNQYQGPGLFPVEVVTDHVLDGGERRVIAVLQGHASEMSVSWRPTTP